MLPIRHILRPSYRLMVLLRRRCGECPGWIRFGLTYRPIAEGGCTTLRNVVGSLMIFGALTRLGTWQEEAAGFATDAPALGSLLRGSRKGGALIDAGMAERSVGERVRALGEAAGIDGLSSHDCRHFWATYWAERIERLPKGLFTLQGAGGWSSLVMPRRYVLERCNRDRRIRCRNWARPVCRPVQPERSRCHHHGRP